MVLKGINKWQPLLVQEDCEYLIEDFQRVQWNEAGSDILKITDRDDDRSLLSHATDGLGYWVMMDMPSSFEIVTVAEVAAERKIEVRNAGRNYRHGQGLAGI
jgi:hypothetical protein